MRKATRGKLLRFRSVSYTIFYSFFIVKNSSALLCTMVKARWRIGCYRGNMPALLPPNSQGFSGNKRRTPCLLPGLVPYMKYVFFVYNT